MISNIFSTIFMVHLFSYKYYKNTRKNLQNIMLLSLDKGQGICQNIVQTHLSRTRCCALLREREKVHL